MWEQTKKVLVAVGMGLGVFASIATLMTFYFVYIHDSGPDGGMADPSNSAQDTPASGEKDEPPPPSKQSNDTNDSVTDLGTQFSQFRMEHQTLGAMGTFAWNLALGTFVLGVMVTMVFEGDVDIGALTAGLVALASPMLLAALWFFWPALSTLWS